MLAPLIRPELGLGSAPKGAYRSEPMKRQRHTEEQIIAVLQEAQAGATIEELCRRHGISQGTYYKWKQKFSGACPRLTTSLGVLRLLEDE